MHNASGPVGPPLTPLDRLKQELHPPHSWSAHCRHQARGSSLVGLGERIRNMEQYTGLYTGEGGEGMKEVGERGEKGEMPVA